MKTGSGCSGAAVESGGQLPLEKRLEVVRRVDVCLAGASEIVEPADGFDRFRGVEVEARDPLLLERGTRVGGVAAEKHVAFVLVFHEKGIVADRVPGGLKKPDARRDLIITRDGLVRDIRMIERDVGV